MIPNIGDGGIGLSVKQEVTIGQVLAFRLLLPGAKREIYIQARVLWTRQEENGTSMEDLRLQDPPLYRKRAGASVDDASSSRHLR